MVWRISISLFAVSALAIWPVPVKYSTGTDVLFIDSGVKVTYQGPSGSNSYSTTLGGSSPASSSASWTSKIVANAIKRTHDSIFTHNFVPWMFNPRGSNFEPSPGNNSGTITLITLKQTQADPSDIQKPKIGSVDESYTLTVASSGDVVVTAKSSLGLLYGLTTFSQLFYEHSAGGAYTKLAPVSVTDSPKFKWRGLNIDTSRTYKPMPQMMKMIDGLSYNKMNRMHWHITDSQSWPLVVPALPELSKKGAYVANQIYTPQDVQQLYEYGALNGVEVVMEIDQPGHTASIAYAYPELIVGLNIQPDWPTYSNEPPSGQFKLNDTAVNNFLQKLFDDVLPRIKPLSSYFHLGGDEVNQNIYNLQNSVGTNATAALRPYIQQFMDRNQKQLASAGFTPLVWEEQLLVWNLTLPKNTIIQAWESPDAVVSIVNQGYQVVAGQYDYWYLDCGKGQWINFLPGQASQDFWPYLDYCNPLKNWRLIYSYDPLTGVPENKQDLVLGGEVHIWSEQTDQRNFETMVWPRASAAGEVLWSGAKDAAGQNRSQIDAAPRLNEMRERLVARGIRADPPQMPFCTQEGHQCDYPFA